MIKFEVDPTRNRFVIRYSGTVTPEETEKGIEEFRVGLPKLHSGFRLLADLSELESMDVKCARFIEKAMDLCNEKGPSMVVRVVPDPHRDIGMSIMSIFHYRSDVKIFTCQSLREADEILADEE